MKNLRNTIKSNKKLWDQLAKTHLDDPFYKVKEFLSGKNSLNAPELSLLDNVSGKAILHLQCHFGLDTLSLARLGGIVTGVDFSSEAIRQAKDLANKSNLSAEFIESDVYGLKGRLDKKFDLVFTSYGVISWLPDLDLWGAIISGLLKQGRHFILVEFHPFLNLLGDDPAEFMFDYFEGGPIQSVLSKSYTGRKLPKEMDEFNWNHSLSAIFKALLSAGLTLEVFEEFDYSPFPCFENMIERVPGEYVWDTPIRIPYLFAFKMKKS